MRLDPPTAFLEVGWAFQLEVLTPPGEDVDEFGFTAKETQWLQSGRFQTTTSSPVGPTGTPICPEGATFRASTSAATTCRILVESVIGVGLAESETAHTSVESGRWQQLRKCRTRTTVCAVACSPGPLHAATLGVSGQRRRRHYLFSITKRRAER